jgi:hypothetical protein
MGLRLVAHGRCKGAGGTSWVVGDAAIDYASFARRAGLSGGASATTTTTSSASAAPAATPSMPLPLAPPVRRERFVLLRGVQWGAADADVLGLSAALAQVWPTPYPREGSELVAHAGVARLANALRAEVKGAIAMSGGAGGGDEDDGGGGSIDDDEPLPIVWAGHSLGGALAKLLWVAEVAEGGVGLARQQRRQRQRRRGAGGEDDDDASDPSSSPPLLPEVLTFGSPPVLAHARGGGSAAMMRALARLAEGGGGGNGGNGSKEDAATTAAASAASVAQYVLEGDPVPRALLSADPTFASLKKQGGLFSAALALNQRLFGEGSPLTPSRFLFEPLGVVKLVRWSAAGGSEVVPLTGAPEDVARGLLAAATTAGGRQGDGAAADAASASASAAAAAEGESAGWSPLASLRAWLDHHHGSYTQELEAAAISALRAEQRAAALQRRGQQQPQQQAR